MHDEVKCLYKGSVLTYTGTQTPTCRGKNNKKLFRLGASESWPNQAEAGEVTPGMGKTVNKTKGRRQGRMKKEKDILRDRVQRGCPCWLKEKGSPWGMSQECKPGTLNRTKKPVLSLCHREHSGWVLIELMILKPHTRGTFSWVSCMCVTCYWQHSFVTTLVQKWQRAWLPLFLSS